MKKFLFSLFFIWLLLIPALADYTVDSITVNAELAKDGSATVNTRCTLTFDAVANSVSIPLPDGSVSDVSVGGETFRLDTDADGVNTVVLTSKAGYGGAQTFDITYQLAAPPEEAFDEDGIDYELNLLSSRWARTIRTFGFQVTLPGSYEEQAEEFTPEPELYSGYFGLVDSRESGMKLSGNTVSGTISNRMAYDSVRLAVHLPDGYLYLRKTVIPVINVRISAIIMLAVWFLCVIYWFAKLRRRGSLTVTKRLMPPEGLLSCQLPIILDGKTVSMSALLLEWANLGYIHIQCGRNLKKGNVVLICKMPMGNERSIPEQQLFNRLFRRAVKVPLQPGRFSVAGARFRRECRRSVNRVSFDRRSGNPVLVQLICRLLLAVGVGIMAVEALPSGAGFVVLGILCGIAGFGYGILLHSSLANYTALRTGGAKTALLLIPAVALVVGGLFSATLPEVAVGLLACCFSAAATARGPRRSSRGLDLLEQVLGCRKFYLNVSWERLQLYMGNDNRFFQQQLPRAVALHCDKAFAKTFDRLACPQPEWLKGVRMTRSTPQKVQRYTRSIIRAIDRAFR